MRRIILLAVLLALVLGCAACGAPDKTPAKNQEKATAEPASQVQKETAPAVVAGEKTVADGGQSPAGQNEPTGQKEDDELIIKTDNQGENQVDDQALDQIDRQLDSLLSTLDQLEQEGELEQATQEQGGDGQ